MKPIPVTLIVAATSSNGIGVASSLPWRLPKEMAYFARVTKACPQGKKNAVIMGRKSWEGIPARWRPLAERVNIVVSRQEAFDLAEATDSLAATSLPSAISLLRSTPDLHRAFLIGGAQLYSLGLLPTPTSPFIANRILLTRIKTEFEDCDVFFPEVRSLEGWTKASHAELVEWVGFEIPEGEQKEVDRNSVDKREVLYEFEMWVKNVGS